MEIYLDNAATSHPKPESVIRAVAEAMDEKNANPGRSSHQRALKAARVLLEGRERLASFFGVSDPFDFVYCLNCTDALNLAIKGSMTGGGHVISTMLEHNSVLRVLMEMKMKRMIDLTLLPPGADGMVGESAVRDALRPDTRLVVVTQASNVTGALQPVAAIGALLRSKGIRFLVDGAQVAGNMPFALEALNCDLYAFPGHKGLLGPQGTGGLYMSPDMVLATLRDGGTGSSSDSMRQPDERPERYESGTMNMHGIAGLSAGVEFVSKHIRDMWAQEQSLTAHLLEGLWKIPGISLYGPKNAADRVGVVSFNVTDLPSSAVADVLDSFGIAVRPGLHCAPGAHQTLGTTKRGAVRASVGHANTHEEIDIFLGKISDIASKGV